MMYVYKIYLFKFPDKIVSYFWKVISEYNQSCQSSIVASRLSHNDFI